MAAGLMMVSLAILASCPPGAWGTTCPDDVEVDLCDAETSGNSSDLELPEVSGAVRSQTCSALVFLLAGILGGGGGAKFPLLLLPLALNPLAAEASSSPSASSSASTCGSMKTAYKQAACCGAPNKSSSFLVVPLPDTKLFKTNICAGKKPVHANATAQDGYFNNVNCLQNGVLQALEQAGANVTTGYVGGLNTGGRTPITTSYLEAGLCPVNVHWHLGAEHLSVGQFDEHGTGPADNVDADGEGNSRRLAGSARKGFRCHKYNNQDAKFTTEYAWQHCKEMKVGETYEVHWPHSAAGACGTPYQYQTPFYDGVFCKDGIVTLAPLNTYTKIGVQAQVFTVVNDEAYYYPDLMRGMIVDGNYGNDVGKYTGSTTGTSRSNTICSKYTPITWQVDRKCQLISASSFDKMCADMKTQSDDMSGDLHPHGARELVSHNMSADNHQRRLSDAGS